MSKIILFFLFVPYTQLITGYSSGCLINVNSFCQVSTVFFFFLLFQGVCETNICLIESNCEIVQLSHAHKALLISTNRRSLLYRTDIKTALVQVGQKDRKV